ncbi:hypothetical protein AB833_13705 [Chromatiales bacterium (ex Bugula neritina AB1)]|nr:hypothetical protein AB833_13705 [Chromatiales bacterium (ex Bugula neritina AB1)]
MNRNLPPVTWLRSFESAARHSNFAAAATELHITPAAVSNQIRSLESHLGFKLFIRMGRGVRLTDLGEAYMQPVSKTFAELSSATSTLFGTAGDRSLNIRCSMSYGALVLAPMLPQFHAANPDIKIQICSTVWAKAIDDDTIDIDIRYGDGHWDDRYIQKITSEYAIPVCTPGFKESLPGNISLAELAGLNNIEVLGSQYQWSNLFDHYGVNHDSSTRWITVDTTVVALHYTLAGNGCALVPECHARQMIDTELLVQTVEEKLPLQSAHYLVVARHADNSPDVKRFCNWILDLNKGPLQTLN